MKGRSPNCRRRNWTTSPAVAAVQSPSRDGPRLSGERPPNSRLAAGSTNRVQASLTRTSGTTRKCRRDHPQQGCGPPRGSVIDQLHAAGAGEGVSLRLAPSCGANILVQARQTRRVPSATCAMQSCSRRCACRSEPGGGDAHLEPGMEPVVGMRFVYTLLTRETTTREIGMAPFFVGLHLIG